MLLPLRCTHNSNNNGRLELLLGSVAIPMEPTAPAKKVLHGSSKKIALAAFVVLLAFFLHGVYALLLKSVR